MKKLNYGSITVVTDQDSDGIGNIFGLVLSHFHEFWPELFKMNFVYRLNTPLIRVFIKKDYIEFYSKE